MNTPSNTGEVRPSSTDLIHQALTACESIANAVCQSNTGEISPIAALSIAFDRSQTAINALNDLKSMIALEGLGVLFGHKKTD